MSCARNQLRRKALTFSSKRSQDFASCVDAQLAWLRNAARQCTFVQARDPCRARCIAGLLNSAVSSSTSTTNTCVPAGRGAGQP